MLTLVGVIGTYLQVIVGIVAIIVSLHMNKQENSNHPEPKE